MYSTRFNKLLYNTRTSYQTLSCLHRTNVFTNPKNSTSNIIPTLCTQTIRRQNNFNHINSLVGINHKINKNNNNIHYNINKPRYTLLQQQQKRNSSTISGGTTVEVPNKATRNITTNFISKIIKKIKSVPPTDYLFYAGNGSQLLAFACTDILVLRLLSISCGACFIGYHYRNKYFSGICWGFAFVLINLVMIIQLMFQKLPIEFTNEELNLYDNIFFPQNITAYEFKKIMNISTKHKIQISNDNYIFCKENKQLNKLYLILNGNLEVKKDNALITTLNANINTGNLI
jgi:hypothetical protein